MEGSPNLYDSIGLAADASTDRIKRAVRRLITDVKESDKRNTEKNELIRYFKSVRETLTDSESRKEYDRSIGIDTVTNDRDRGHPVQSMVPFEAQGSAFQPFGASFAGPMGIGCIGSLLGSPNGSPSSPPPSSLVGLLGADIRDMFSSSIIPEELASSAGGLKPGTFQVLEYTKVRNSEGGFDEFGFSRQGDMRNDRVTEKRFERKS